MPSKVPPALPGPPPHRPAPEPWRYTTPTHPPAPSAPAPAPANEHPNHTGNRERRRRAPVFTGGVVFLLAAVSVGLFAGPVLAATAAPPASLPAVINSLTTWLVGLLAALATLFLTIGGLRYLTAGGDPMHVERAKTALKSAAIGYALAALAPLLVKILASVVGG